VNKRLQTLKYLISDYLSALSVWICFFAFRKLYVEPQKFGYDVPVEFDKNFYLGLLIIPLYWLTIYNLTGTYNKIYKKSRLREIAQTATQTFAGVLVLFFTVILDDEIANYTNYYVSFFTLVALHFSFTAIPRFAITTNTKLKIKRRIIGFNTLLVGSNDKAFKLYDELER